MKHFFTHTGELKRVADSYCGDAYCSGHKEYNDTRRHACSCGYVYGGEKNKVTELEHVLIAEGFYEA